MLLSALLDAGPQAAAQTSRPAIAGRRIVKHFDFNEVPLGNFEATPLFWRRRMGEGYSLFLEGAFDPAMYHTAAPGFRMTLDGGSIAYEYLGGDIAVRTRSDYLVAAWIRTAGLDAARAYLTACYLDRKKQPIPGTERRSAMIGGPGSPSDWTPVTLGLPGNEPGARYIGVSIWLTQERIWNTTASVPRSVHHEDIQGTAWFDDITVYRLPRVTLELADGKQATTGQVRLIAEVSDPDGLNLSAELIVRDRDGRIVEQRPVPAQSLDATEPATITCDGLSVGRYQAELVVNTDDMPLVRRSTSFLVLPPHAGPPGSVGRGFGVILNDTNAAVLNGQIDLIRHLLAEYVKLPVWNAQAAAAADPIAESSVGRYLQAIVQSRADPVGILTDPPRDDSPDRPARSASMLDIFSRPPDAWRPLIAGVWSRHAGLIHVWQIGADHDESLADDPRLGTLLPTLRQEMASLVGEPLLATSARVDRSEDIPRYGDYTTLSLPAHIPVDSIDAYLKAHVSVNARRTWVTVEPPFEDAYERDVRLADLARRLVEAAWQQPAAVFMKAPWNTSVEGTVSRLEPSEDYLILRTVADALGDARPIARLELDRRAPAMLFDRHGRAVIFTWDPSAPPEGRDYALPLGETAVQLDLLGRSLPLGRSGEQRVARIGPTPTFIMNAPTWLIDFRRHVAIEPFVVESSLEPREVAIRFVNPSKQPIAGVLHLVGPPDWDLRPTRVTFALQPGQEFREPLTLRFPLNAAAEATPLVGEFELDADQRYRFKMPIWFELGLNNIDIETYAYRSGDAMLISLQFTNRTDEPVHFEAHLLAPGRDRLIRLLTNFPPNQTVTKTFQLEDAAELSGRYVRLALKEIRGSRVWNRTFLVP